jgi:ribose 5-phosphate isomerase B
MKKIAIGCDHGGFELKKLLKRFLSEKGYIVRDFGVHSEEPSDYPLIGYEVSKGVSDGRFKRAILICKTGIGMAIIANKLRNVRAAACTTVAQARTSLEHNDTNVLSLAAQYADFKKAKLIVTTWLKTEALGGRHKRRVNQIKILEKTGKRR